MLSDLVSQSATRPYEAVLDLGCGSGLTGRQFVDKSRRITGVDLSREMLSRAGLLGIYDRLVESDLETHLWNTDERYDLVLCCDVFIYLGDLSGVFAGVHRVLQAGGSFAFTIEPCDADSGYDLLPTLRYAHSESYIRRLATEFKFHVRGIAEGALRDEDHRSVEGLAVHLERAQPEP